MALPSNTARPPAPEAATSATILERFRHDHARDNPGDINLTLRPTYRALLEALGNPHEKLPPVFHVAGTNGKGSTCAFLRAMLEAAGHRVHVYTSPHLVHFHERIRIAGQLIEEGELVEILSTIERLAKPGSISYFEAATAAAFVAFSRHAADFAILEVGLGGRLDATNVIEKPRATIITRLSFDHRDYLGNTLAEIAREKAGIMKKGVPCFAAAQPDAESTTSLRAAAAEKGAVLIAGDKEWRVEATPNGFRFSDHANAVDLPRPALIGDHQLQNAGLAIAALAALPNALPAAAIIRGLQSVEWPARLQKITQGKLAALVPDCELWLDGGHNDSAGEVLAAQAKRWVAESIQKRPLELIFGMLRTKNPREFLVPLAPYIARVLTVDIPAEPTAFPADELAQLTRAAGIKNVNPVFDVPRALMELASSEGRLLIGGSLYLAGHVLRLNGA